MVQPRYKILFSDSTENLSKQVDEYIGRGWLPQGGLAIVEASRGEDEHRESYYMYGQAVFLSEVCC